MWTALVLMGSLIMVEDIPHFVQYSLNIKGLSSKKSRQNKMAWVNAHIRSIKNLGIIHFQETKFKNLQEAKRCFRGMKGKVIGASFHPDRRKNGVVSWVPKCSPKHDMIEEVEVAGDGRWAVMRISSNLESLHIANGYLPSSSELARKIFMQSIKPNIDLSDLIIVGDWNFCSSALDKFDVNGSVEPTKHPLIEEILDELDLEDVYRYYYEEEKEITFIHENKNSFARLDRFYAQTHLLDLVAPMPTILGAVVSDHSAVGMTFRTPEVSDKIEEGHYRISRVLLKLITSEKLKVHLQ